MLQPHSFFLSPQIYFGPIEAEELEIEDDENFSDSYRIPIELQFIQTEKNQAGLFIEWTDFPTDFS